MPTKRSRSIGHHALTLLAVAGSAGLVAMMPRALGMGWSAVGEVLAGISVSTLVALGGLWVAGLLVHTVVLTAALPELTQRRALLLKPVGQCGV